jgi:molecular chaperone GrpE
MTKQNSSSSDGDVKLEDIKDEKGDVVDEFKGKYLRALADYQNLERQTAVWKEAFVQYSNVSLIKKILEVLDDLEKAQEHIRDEGLQLVISKLKGILTAEGLEELNLEGKEYNPGEAEVVSTEPGEADNVITKVLQKGYKIKDRVIRPAKVVVATAGKNS